MVYIVFVIDYVCVFMLQFYFWFQVVFDLIVGFEVFVMVGFVMFLLFWFFLLLIVGVMGVGFFSDYVWCSVWFDRVVKCKVVK